MKVLLLSSLLILTVACNGSGGSDSKKGQEQDSYTDGNAEDSQPKLSGVYMNECQLDEAGEQGENDNDTWLRTQLVISKENKITMTQFFYSDDECKRQQSKDSIAFVNPKRQGDGSLTATYKDPEVGMVKGNFSVDGDQARAELCLQDECFNYDLYRVK